MHRACAAGIGLAVAFATLGTGLARAECPLQVAGAHVEQISHPTVRLVAARIEVEVGVEQSKVTCQYVFRNEGPATTVVMGFPATVGGGWVERPRPLRELRSWVDGRSAPTSLKTTTRGEGYYAKSVRLEPDQRRVVRDLYFQPTLSVPGGLAFVFPLDLGKRWHGDLGRLEVVLRWTGDYEWGRPRVTGGEGAGWVVSAAGRELKRSQTNVEKSAGLRLEFLPGWDDLRVDGYRLNAGPAEAAMRVTTERTLMSTRALGQALCAQVSYDPATKRALIIGSHHKVVVTTGSDTAMVDGREVRLAQAARYESGRQWVATAPIFERLGWRMLADHRNWRLELFTGQPPAWQAQVKGPSGKVESLYLVSRGGVLLGEIRPLVAVIPGAEVSSPQAGEEPHGSVKLVLGKQEPGPHFEGGPPGSEGAPAHELWLTWGTPQARLDGKQYALTSAPYVNLLGHGMGPVAVICKALGLKAAYSEDSKMVTVTE